MSSNKLHPIRLARFAILTILAGTGALWWVVWWVGIPLTQSIKGYEHVVPPSSIQTFHDFLRWEIEIQYCREVDVRGITYFHVIGPNGRDLASGGALYVFDANGNYVGWSRDEGDIMRNEGVFYPRWWLPRSSSVTDISLDELKDRIPEESDLDRIRLEVENANLNTEDS